MFLAKKYFFLKIDIFLLRQHKKIILNQIITVAISAGVLYNINKYTKNETAGEMFYEKILEV